MSEVNGNKIYVGNLPFSTGFEELKELFSVYGKITDSTVIANHYTGRSKGFGFLTFADKESAKKAIAEMDGKEHKGRNLRVKSAEPPKEKDNRPKEDNGQGN